MLEAQIKLDWLPVEMRGGQPYFYPSQRSAISNERYSVPCVCRWALQPNDGKPAFLVGETDDPYRRLGEYLGHKGKRHAGLRGSFDRCSSNGRVALEILDFDPFKVNGVEFSKEKLHDPFVRGLLESLCCASLQMLGFHLLNETFSQRLTRKLVKLEKDAPGTIAALAEKLKAQRGES